MPIFQLPAISHNRLLTAAEQLPAETRPTGRRSGMQQLLHLAPRFGVLALRLFENGKLFHRRGAVVPTTFQFCDDLVLSRDAHRVAHDILVDLRQMLFDPWPVHLITLSPTLSPTLS
jgi:hypothetical protein